MFDCDAHLDKLQAEMPRRSKREIRAAILDLFGGERPTEYLLTLKRHAEEEGAESVSNNLYRGAWRRARKDDPGSCEQMLFCCALLDLHGPRGLTF